MSEMGVAGTIGVKVLESEVIVNEWLQDNPDLEVIDIRFAVEDGCEVFCIIYRKEDQT